ncbi:MAG: nucleotidyltransferase domain-containing protein [Opitutaceae bacterium]|nr:nucleotidyltransferase domain-containing protein [Opitutaceae bacterium]
MMETNASALAELCRQFRVDHLYLFGSATGERFDPEKSDLDFFVSLQDRAPTGDYAERFLGLADALERLFRRRLDLVTEQSIRNPYFRREIESTRQLIYGQP